MVLAVLSVVSDGGDIGVEVIKGVFNFSVVMTVASVGVAGHTAM